MSDVAVRAESVGKEYQLGQLESSYQLLSEVIGRRLRGIGRRRERRERFLALDDVSFEVPKGETFGIIGHNGAGKSTLLKILSRVTPPTTGEVQINGRVGALLEVGTGFHAELTGRENVYLNGAILGMRRAEIERRFDEIVEFAEVEQFIDTPVKRYSSGMYLRLAFSVAAHLEPEILIVDEVLSVGDLAFQRKCLGRMNDVAAEGRTVLFVSHNLSAVSNLCARSMLLSRGRKVTEGPTSDVIDRYVTLSSERPEVSLEARDDRQGSGRVRFTSIAFSQGGRAVDVGVNGRDLDIAMAYGATDGQSVRRARVIITVSTLTGQLMLQIESDAQGGLSELPPEGSVTCTLPGLPLPPGRYAITVVCAIGTEILDYVVHACDLTVVDGDFYGTGYRPPESHPAVMVATAWSVSEEPVPVGPPPVIAPR